MAAQAECGRSHQMYVPGVNGRPGMVMSIPGRACPAAAPAVRFPRAPAHADQGAALAAGVERFCRPFLAGALRDDAVIEAAAFAAGYAVGIRTLFSRALPGLKLDDDAPWVFEADIGAARGAGLATAWRDPPHCEVSADGGAPAAEAYMAARAAAGWTTLGPRHVLAEGTRVWSLLAPDTSETLLVQLGPTVEGEPGRGSLMLLPGRHEVTPELRGPQVLEPVAPGD